VFVLMSAGARDQTIVNRHERSRRWPVNHSAFATPLNVEAWYWLGFLAADGNVAGTRVSFGLAPGSESALRRFTEFMGCPERPLRLSANGRQLIAEVHSRPVVDDLARHGVVPRKTWSLEVSSEAAREPAFWLGHLDGDGSVVLGQTGVPRIQYVGTRTLMEQLSGFLADKVLNRQPSVHRHSRTGMLWQVKVGGDSARLLAAALLHSYPSSLETKRSKLTAAAAYVSRRTEARKAVRRRRCSWCGAWVERYPSQMTGEHVFCDSSHFGRWHAPLANLGPDAPAPRSGGYNQRTPGL
jgi:hypothetical protein